MPCIRYCLIETHFHNIPQYLHLFYPISAVYYCLQYYDQPVLYAEKHTYLNFELNYCGYTFNIVGTVLVNYS